MSNSIPSITFLLITPMDMVNAIQNRTLYHDKIDGTVRPIITHQYHESKWIPKAIRTIKDIAASSGDLFVVTEDKCSPTTRNDYTIKPRNKLANDFVMLLHQRFIEDLIGIFPNYEMNPYFEAIVGNEQFFDVSSQIRRPLPPYGTQCFELAKTLNCFVEAMRQDAKRPDFKAAVKGFERSANKNHQSLMRYIGALFGKYSKLLVLRLDLEYRIDEKTGRSHGVNLAHEKVAEHRDTFFTTLPNYLKRRLDKDVSVGYVWKLEYGPTNGWHHHTLLFLDGQKVREDVGYGKIIGDYWNQITENTGRYFNCNADKTVYQRQDTLGIGLIDHRDRKLRHNLENIVAEYLTKIDACAKLKLPEGARSFGRGIMPKLTTTRRGRPRIQSI